MKILLNTTPIALLFIALPIAALANISGTQTLSASQTLSLDTGSVATSGGDILWTGSSITPQGSAAVYNAPSSLSGASTFALLESEGQAVLAAYNSFLGTSPIPASSLVVGDIFVFKTNGGNFGGALVTAVGGGSITLQFITFSSSSAAPSGPAITQVLNNYGLVPAGFSNSGVAQGSLFIIKGSGLANPGAQALPLQSSASPGLPNTLNGASVKVTVNGTTTVPVFYYAIPSQLALVLPSNTPTGTGQVTVTYNGQASAAFSIQVVANAMGFDAYYGTGSGLGVAQNPATGAVYTYANSIPPGTPVSLWGSGLGADSARDTTFVPASSTSTINSLAHVYVGGVDAPIAYQGASGYPGLNLVDITIPANAPTGCNVSMVGVSTTGVPTNFTTLPIGNGPCSDAAFGTAGTTISTLSEQTTVNTGFVLLDQGTSPAGVVSDVALAVFESQSGSAYGTAVGSVSIGGCTVQQNLTSAAVTPAGLNAGTITMTGPAGSATLTSVGSILPGYYESMLPSGFIPASGGSFKVNGSGGTNVGAFNTMINYPNPLLTWTNQSAGATITRAAGAPITWNGGSSGTFVLISGSATATGTSGASGSFTCIATVSADQFTVPGYVLAALPAGSGSLSVSNYTNYTSFTATGLDYGYAAGFVTYDISSTYQ